MQLNAKRTQIERKKNILRTDPQIRELSGNDFNPAKEPRTETIVENKNSSVCRKKELILNISKNFNRIEGPGTWMSLEVSKRLVRASFGKNVTENYWLRSEGMNENSLLPRRFCRKGISVCGPFAVAIALASWSKP